MRGFAVLSTILATLVAWLWMAASAKATYQPGCVTQKWMIGLRMGTRTLCDGPIFANGSWNRERQFNARSFIADGVSVCYGYGVCTYSLPREIPEIATKEFYVVTPETVLPDEPGHIDPTSIT